MIDPELLAAATWTTPPVAVEGADVLQVTAAEGSDAWRHTSYGFVHDDAHGLLAPLGARDALEVEFRLDYTEQFDQAVVGRARPGLGRSPGDGAGQPGQGRGDHARPRRRRAVPLATPAPDRPPTVRAGTVTSAPAQDPGSKTVRTQPSSFSLKIR